MLEFAATINSSHISYNRAICALRLRLCNSFRVTPYCSQPSSVLLRIPASSRSNITSIKAMAGAVVSTEKTGSHTLMSGNKQALISLSNKQDLAFLGNGLLDLGYTIVSTGGTASALEEAGISVSKVEQLTGFPEMLDGRVKTLHPNIHGGILARRDKNDHIEALNKHGIGSIDIVVVNLYPFYDKVSSTSGIAFEDGVENIDIGGPAMIRAAAKNHKDVLVVVDSQDYPALLDFLKGCEDDQNFRRKLAWKAFQHVASYDSAVSEWMWKQTVGDKFPPSLTVPLLLKSSLRYGENPHQKAAFYVNRSLAEVNAGGIATAIQHHGKVQGAPSNAFSQQGDPPLHSRFACIPVLGVVEQIWKEEDCDYANEMLQWENKGEKDVRLAISANRQEQEKEIERLLMRFPN
ncbi:hypothetical protein GIB67_018070 [Kingdonia uniflora]|uniref:MGS-like domain-containing protein n=1 Tax=Kingdonia uniflora TaxID=39325 RepID=A0A7J7NWH7_9MAGN|nr:hypothetical protein GIB67_018070 [Kingdonia uniflora]